MSWLMLISGGYLFAVGGRDQQCQILSSAEKYDPSTNTWHTVVQELPEHQQRYQCCLLKMPASVVHRLQQQQARSS